MEKPGQWFVRKETFNYLNTMIPNSDHDKQDQSTGSEQLGGIDTAGTKGTQPHNNNTEDKPVSNPPNTASGQEANKEDSED
jgi:hypothetical protein